MNSNRSDFYLCASKRSFPEAKYKKIFLLSRLWAASKSTNKNTCETSCFTSFDWSFSLGLSVMYVFELWLRLRYLSFRCWVRKGREKVVSQLKQVTVTTIAEHWTNSVQQNKMSRLFQMYMQRFMVIRGSYYQSK